MAYVKPDWESHRGRIPCPECGEDIYLSINRVALDMPARPIEECQPIGMALSYIGTQLYAVYDDRARMGHPMHAHQPPEG